MVRDIMQRFPEQRDAYLAYEIHRRERDRILYASVRHVTGLHAWSAVKSMLVTGFTIFSLLFALGLAASFANWVQGLQAYKINVPMPLTKGLDFDVGSLVPTSTLIVYAAKLPMIRWQDAVMVAFIVMAIMLLGNIISGYLLWNRTRSIQNGIMDIEDEIKILKSWQ